MDKLLEHPEFTCGTSLICHATFVAGEESGWANLKAQVASDSRLSHSLALDDALLAFTTMDFAGLLGLGHLDVRRVRALCAFEEGEDVAEGVAVVAGGTGAGVGDGGVAGAGDAGGNVISNDM